MEVVPFLVLQKIKIQTEIPWDVRSLLFVRLEYNAEHSQLEAEAKMGYKGLQQKSGKHYALVRRIATLICENHYSPYAVLNKLDDEGSQPSGLRICEKTLYNGVEFSLVKELEHSIFTNDTRTTLYFAHPYCSSERETIKNHNGIIRRFLPKGTDFSCVSYTRIREIQDWMNTYPRKILGGFTPLHCFKEAFGFKDQTIELLEACS